MSTNEPPSDEELELMQDYGGHEPECGDALLAALRHEQVSRARDSLVAREELAYMQRLQAFRAAYAEGSD